MTLKSNASGNAMVATGSTAGSYITNNVIVERYIPARRAFRIVSPSVTTTTSINANWQESGSSNGSFGTHITGNSGSANGFDNTATNNPLYSVLTTLQVPIPMEVGRQLPTPTQIRLQQGHLSGC